jgi:L-alanine-DL-glutamate epimerase-like enolase superfamily enzyme
MTCACHEEYLFGAVGCLKQALVARQIWRWLHFQGLRFQGISQPQRVTKPFTLDNGHIAVPNTVGIGVEPLPEMLAEFKKIATFEIAAN